MASWSSVNYELGANTAGDWVTLFEIRFSSRIQQLCQRIPQDSTALARPPSVLGSGAPV